MEKYIGTSGWMYPWNKDKSLDWYIKNSKLNAIELNSSFYRFPYPNQIASWAKSASQLTWVVKVNKAVTHIHMLNAKSYSIYSEFTDAFKPMKSIKLFLLQMPPKFTTKLEERLRDFISSFETKNMALEFRHLSWYNYDFSKLEFKGVIVSPDSPEISNKIFKKNEAVYLRFHGRKDWYAYKYDSSELSHVAEKIIAINPKILYAFFNNDAYMLSNARSFSKLLQI
jgi:uncharacterized protein YecE (DUF72 family)